MIFYFELGQGIDFVSFHYRTNLNLQSETNMKLDFDTEDQVRLIKGSLQAQDKATQRLLNSLKQTRDHFKTTITELGTT